MTSFRGAHYRYQVRLVAVVDRVDAEQLWELLIRRVPTKKRYSLFVMVFLIET